MRGNIDGRMEKVFRTAWKTPHDFLKTVGMHLDMRREKILDELEPAETTSKTYDFDCQFDTKKVLCAWLMWRVLSNPGFCGAILGKQDERHVLMNYLNALSSQLEATHDYCIFDRGIDRIGFGITKHWAILARSNRSRNQALALRGVPIISSLVLNAGETQIVEIEGELSLAPILRCF